MMRLRPLLYPALLVLLLFANALRATPGPQLEGPPHLDKVIHFLFFGFLATTLVRAPMLFQHRWGGLWAWGGAVLVAVLDESFQALSPFRTADPLDVLADAFGAALAIVLYLKWTHYRKILEWPVCTSRNSPTP